MFTLEDVKAAQKRIAPYVLRTPLLRIPAMDPILGCQVYLKAENFQYTNAFKLRGATNRMLQLTPEERARGVVCLSSGNHAQGVACAAHRLGLDAVIVMPTNVNPAKLAGVRLFTDIKVELVGTEDHERAARAEELVRTEGRVMIHPYMDDAVKAGQGTVGLEIMQDEPEMDAVVVSVSGGGLITGIATAAKGIQPDVRIIGVEPTDVARYKASREAHHAVTLGKSSSIADGTLLPEADPGNYELIEKLVETLIPVDDGDIRRAIVTTLQVGKLLAEPSAAMTVAAAMAGGLPVKPEDKVCFVISGGNCDMHMLAELLK